MHGAVVDQRGDLAGGQPEPLGQRPFGIVPETRGRAAATPSTTLL
jgi:hypothetical protein